jgi:Putative DNA-binding domain
VKARTMALLHIPLDQIDEAQLRRLIDGQAEETRDIEYKRQSYGKADNDYGEFLADVSSFANASGGDIILGIEARAGIPVAFNPIARDEADNEKLRLEGIVRTGLQPRISGFDMRAVPVSSGAMIVIRVPRSYNGPHRIVRGGKGHNRFFARSSAGKYEPNIDELRSLFTRAPQLAERIRDFRLDRVAKIVANDAPTRLEERDAIIIHVVPFSAFDKRMSLPLTDVYNLYLRFPPLGSAAPQNFRINFDGLLTLSNAYRDAPAQRAYAQLFRSGIVEAISSILIGEGSPENPRRGTSQKTESYIAGGTYGYVRELIELGCDPPFAVLVTLIGVKGMPYGFVSTARNVFEFDQDTGTFDRDQLHFPEVIVEALPPDPYEYANLLRPLFNEIANAAGRHSTVSFENGRFGYRI